MQHVLILGSLPDLEPFSLLFVFWGGGGGGWGNWVEVK